ncbi:MAG: hypothetical protein EHM93_12180 [Bacteroidales bacterium]|nr:MAG: hypothetical protein EHM93_12180 [Bacteroidales bacterium]
MKALLSILIVALISATISANPSNKRDYIITKDGKIVFAKIQFGLLKIKAMQENGEKTKFDYSSVESYQMNGETYSQKPLYNDKHYEGMVFMKKIGWRNGLGLYCYEDPLIISSNNKRYFVYKDETTLWLEVDSRSAENIQRFYNRM